MHYSGQVDKQLVVIGLGYVGLPLVQAACRSNFKVYGLDVNSEIVNSLNSGSSHIDDLSHSDLNEMLENGFLATTDATVIKDADVVVICVPTPLSQEGGPDLRAVKSAAKTIAENLTPDTLVILESTTYPGTTEEVVLPILEMSGLSLESFDLAFSPERIDPGNPQYGISNTPKVVGGANQKSAERAENFYAKFVEKVIVAQGTREAEMAKLLENTYRHVNIAMMNELVEFCNLLDINLWNAIACAATKPFGYQAFYPGPGVGGHCIPIDPNYLSHHVKTVLGKPFRFVELAQEINAGMPNYVRHRIQDALNDVGKSVKNSRILLLGVTYKPDIADQRESPVRPLARELLSLGSFLDYHDPFVPEWNLDAEHDSDEQGRTLACIADLQASLKQADIVVLLQAHASYDLEQIAHEAKIVLDTRGKLSGPNVINL